MDGMGQILHNAQFVAPENHERSTGEATQNCPNNTDNTSSKFSCWYKYTYNYIKQNPNKISASLLAISGCSYAAGFPKLCYISLASTLLFLSESYFNSNNRHILAPSGDNILPELTNAERIKSLINKFNQEGKLSCQELEAMYESSLAMAYKDGQLYLEVLDKTLDKLSRLVATNIMPILLMQQKPGTEKLYLNNKFSTHAILHHRFANLYLSYIDATEEMNDYDFVCMQIYYIYYIVQIKQEVHERLRKIEKMPRSNIVDLDIEDKKARYYKAAKICEKINCSFREFYAIKQNLADIISWSNRKLNKILISMGPNFLTAYKLRQEELTSTCNDLIAKVLVEKLPPDLTIGVPE